MCGLSINVTHGADLGRKPLAASELTQPVQRFALELAAPLLANPQ
jgi:hypothetical protein